MRLNQGWERDMAVLPPEDAVDFQELINAVLFLADKSLKLVPGSGETIFEACEAWTVEDRVRIRNALLPNWVDFLNWFVRENPFEMPAHLIQDVAGFRLALPGPFVVTEFRKDYAIAVDFTTGLAYGAVGVSKPLGELLTAKLPIPLLSILLPFRGRMVFDGMLLSPPAEELRQYAIDWGRTWNSQVIISRELDESPVPPAKSTGASRGKAARSSEKSAERVAARREFAATLAASVRELLDEFCQARLDDEYAVLLHQAVDRLSRPPSDFTGGSPEVWAAAIVRAVGYCNFLHDAKQKPHCLTRDIDAAFGVKSSTASNKAARVREWLDMELDNEEWIRPSFQIHAPLLWLVEDLNGMLLDARQLPRDRQVEMHRRGLIPFVPADHPERSPPANVQTDSVRKKAEVSGRR
jgi:hypothetical protein